MVILILFGLVGNFFGEKARSMIWQIMIDKVYAQTPGYSYNLAESGLFLVSFWVGAVLTVVWGTLLFLFGLSLFQETSLGKDRVDTWTPFNLDFGLSYLFWTLLILYGAGYPGCLLWWALYSSVDMSLNQFVLVSQFFCFPVLFLCVIESETFFGTWPRKTLRSLRHNPGLWLKLYGIALILTGIPSAIVVGLYRLGTLYDEHWIMHSFFYYLIASILLTFAGFFVILYFRLLGLAAREIRVVAK